MLTFQVYTDGSYMKAVPNKTAGAVAVIYNDQLLCAQRYVTRDGIFVSMNNVGGELLAAMNSLAVIDGLARKLELEDKGYEICIYHDYTGIREFIEGTPVWSPKKEGAKVYVYMVQSFLKDHPNVHLRFVKVKAHSGSKWNELVDSIANGIIPNEYRGKMLKEIVS